MPDFMVGAWDAIGSAVGSVLAVAINLYNSFGVVGMLSGIIFIYSVYRFLLMPIIGGQFGASDKARKSDDKGDGQQDG